MTTTQSLTTLYWELLICAIEVCAQTGTDPSQFFKRRSVKPIGQETKLVYFNLSYGFPKKLQLRNDK